MKRILIFILAAMVALPSFAQSGVKWEQGTLQEALNKAKKNKKGPNVVFVDCYTTWCGPCRHMSKDVFPTKEAGDYFNKRFVNIQIDMEKGEGVDVKKKYDVGAYPTFLILDTEGKELGRVVGSAELSEFIQSVEDAQDAEHSPSALLEKYRKTKDPDAAYAYLNALEGRYMKGKVKDFVVSEYDSLPSYIKCSEKMWGYIKNCFSLENPELLDKVLKDKMNFNDGVGRQSVDKAISSSLGRELVYYMAGRTNPSGTAVEKACETLKMTSDGSKYDSFIVNAAEAYRANDTTALMRMFDPTALAYMFDARQRQTLQSVYLGMKNVPEYAKARFMKDYRSFLDGEKKSTDSIWEKYKDVVIPEDKSGAATAIPVMMLR
jgi:thioredoxin-related protein